MKSIICFLHVFFLLCFFSFSPIANGQEVGAEWVIPPVLESDDIEIPYDTWDFSRIVVKTNGKEGLCSRTGEVLIPIEYDHLKPKTDGWVVAFKDQKQFLFNDKIEPIGLPYDRFHAPGNRLSIVYKDELCGLINEKGEEILPLKFNQVILLSYRKYKFKNDTEEILYDAPPKVLSEFARWKLKKNERFPLKGFYRVTGFGGFEGLVNEARDTVVSPIYHLGTPHPNGYIIATFDRKKWGVIDTKNNTLYPFTADKLGDWTDSGLLPVRADKQMGVLKFPDAEEVIPFGKYEDIKVYDAQKDIFLVTQNKLKALVNAEEETILPFDYTFISQADHYVHQLHHKDGQKGFWNDKNGFISEYQYDRIHNLKDSLIIVEKDGTWALLDAKNGQEVIPFSDFFIEKKGDYFISHKKYDFQMSSTVKGHLNGLYDRSGQVVLPHDSVDIVVFPDQTFWVQPQAKSSKMECEHRTRHGEVLRRLPKIGVEVISGNSWIFNSKNPEGKYQATFFSYLDPPGKENYFQRIDSPSENLLLVKQGKLYGYADKEGRVIIPPAFEAAEKSSKGLLKVKYKGKWGVLKNPMFDYLK